MEKGRCGMNLKEAREIMNQWFWENVEGDMEEMEDMRKAMESKSGNKEEYKKIAEDLLSRIEIEEYCEKILQYLRRIKEEEYGITRETLSVLEEGVNDFVVNIREVWEDKDIRRAEKLLGNEEEKGEDRVV